MHSYNFVSHSEEDTIKFADEFAAKLNGHSIIVLSGDLGSGKTKFTEGILKHFGLENEISSPTFTIVNEYDAKNFKIFHFDLYRLADVDEFYAMGGEEYLQNGLCIFEWGEMIEDILQTNYTKITFSRDNDNTDIRKLEIEEI
jgi:tRNA threonylcarbamoyladenosine biosynthesis protein TsaE